MIAVAFTPTAATTFLQVSSTTSNLSIHFRTTTPVVPGMSWKMIPVKQY